MVEVTLEWYEIQCAAIVGITRRVEILSGRWQGTKYRNPKPEMRWSTDVESACAEMAWGKYAGMYWSASVNTGKDQADLGKENEIRHCFLENGHLIIRKGDPNESIYWLVTGMAPRFKIVGWIKGKDGKKEEWVKDADSWFVPQMELEAVFDTSRMMEGA